MGTGIESFTRHLGPDTSSLCAGRRGSVSYTKPVNGMPPGWIQLLAG